ncbi:nitrate/sulfonate/bicarbonate ABC transporter ATP-binding protein [Spirochaetia bacterium]|nr:nitrate/sulfonate/bicarbonate ABC transporter ATP-binding protein [Spirochaetia bacterium]
MNPVILSSISIKNLSFGFSEKPLFKNLNLELGNDTQPGPMGKASPLDSPKWDDSPTVILGPSGCGKTTLLRLIAVLLKPHDGELTIRFRYSVPHSITAANWRNTSFVFQEPRLLPWKTVLQNVMLPITGIMGKTEAENRARHFLDLVSLGDKEAALPSELSGGQQQRAGIARAFAYPGQIILMDEPFQSLDIPLRIQLMDLTNRLLQDFPRLAVIVTHDPREAVYMGNRIIVLGNPPGGIIFDENVTLPQNERRYGSAVSAVLEERLIQVMRD